MLVLSRRLLEAIVIDGDVTITVVEIRGDSVKLGFDVPKDVAVDREEIAQAKRRQLEC